MFRQIKTIAETKIGDDNRIKCVRFHPTEPLLVLAYFSGEIQIIATNNYSVMKTIHFDASQPVRCAVFMTGYPWILATGDNMAVSAYDYNTGNLISTKDHAHNDYIRQIAIHPTLPMFLTCSDDRTVKSFKFTSNNEIELERTFTGHSHFVMDVKINPKDPSTFATASLDSTIIFWGLTASNPRFTLTGHTDGVNCIEFFPGSDKPFIASGSDDFSICIWDYQSKSCIATLSGHTNNVTALRFHPTYPVLFSTGEDQMFFIWNTTTYQSEFCKGYNKKRGWSIDIKDNIIAVGFDNGLVVSKFGRDNVAVITMDTNGRAYWAKNNDIQSTHLNQFTDLSDGETVDVIVKDVSTSEIMPTSISYSSNNRYVSVCGEYEYAIYSALAWRSKSFGQAQEFVWGVGDVFALRKSNSTVAISTSFQDPVEFAPPLGVSRIYGGYLLGIASDVISFYTWDTKPTLVRQIDVKPTGIWWSTMNSTSFTSGTYVAISTHDSLFVLQYNEGYMDNNDYDPEAGSESAFIMVGESDGNIQSGLWFGDIFFFIDKNNLCFFAGGQIEKVAHLDKSMTIVGYVQKVERLFLCDNEYNFVSYSIPLSIMEFVSTVVARKNQLEQLNEEEQEEEIVIDPSLVPEQWKSKMCTMLENLEFYEIAIQLCNNDDKKFDLALKLNDTKTAAEIAHKTGSTIQYQRLSTIALSTGNMSLLQESLEKSGDNSGLLLMDSCIGNKKRLHKACEVTNTTNKNSLNQTQNVSFAAAFATRDFNQCIDILLESGKIPEAALMARSYLPSRIEECAKRWKQVLVSRGEELTSQTIALPSEYPEKFPELENIEEQQQEIESKQEIENQQEIENDVKDDDDLLNEIINDDVVQNEQKVEKNENEKKEQKEEDIDNVESFLQELEDD